MKNLIRFLAAGALLAALGCRSPMHIPPRFVPGAATVHTRELPPRLLKEGDRLRLVFVIGVDKDGEEDYKLGNLDEIEIAVRDRPDLSGAHVVVPSGWLYAPLIEPLRVKNMTVKDLQELLNAKYKEKMESPQVSVRLTKPNRGAEIFIAGLVEESRVGPQYEAAIDRDGTAVLPLLGTMRVSGMTLSDLNNLLLKKYKEKIPAIQVSVTMQGNGMDAVSVLGEVKKPVAIPVTGSLSLAEALGTAGGWTTAAALSHVFIIREREGKITVKELDLKRNILLSAEERLIAGDMVYVPGSKRTDINLMIDQLIRRNIPINPSGFAGPMQ